MKALSKGGPRRKYKNSRPKVRVGLPKKNPKVLKPAFTIPPKLLQSLVEDPKWDEKGSVTQNYNSFGVVNDPNSLTDNLQAPSVSDDPNDSGSDLEEDDLKSALGKRRRDGKSALPQPLTSIQRLYISRLVEKYGADFQRMMMDIKLNPMQHSVATLEKLCMSYYIYKNKNPLIIFVGGLDPNVTDEDLRQTFSEYGEITSVKIPIGKGCGFVQFANSKIITVKNYYVITRCSDVKPLMQVAVYTCEDCGFEIYQEVTARIFMPLFECPSRRCVMNKSKGNVILQLRASKFLRFQEAKIQELAEHVPKGHIPRTMIVHLRGELTRKVAPGDVVELSGIFLPIPYVGFRAMRAGLVADTYLEAMFVSHFKKKYEEYELRGDEEEQIKRLAEDGDIYDKLARSLAPEIFGHEDIKKALLLLLVGAPQRQLKDGMKVINFILFEAHMFNGA
ncbi:Mcm2-7 hexameric complex component [Lathyrus oleraceus]|uniref:DNA replication licensing factor MCM7 n=1 Tax=Pisum sativum TaxID=3888 RepID=A0A9D4YBJ5_PEA|nr:Mcm2-7 hexameric complex component [Pisum sativum]